MLLFFFFYLLTNYPSFTICFEILKMNPHCPHLTLLFLTIHLLKPFWHSKAFVIELVCNWICNLSLVTTTISPLLMHPCYFGDYFYPFKNFPLKFKYFLIVYRLLSFFNDFIAFIWLTLHHSYSFDSTPY